MQKQQTQGMISFADKTMFPALTDIWEQSFGDSRAYIRMFLDENFERIKTVVCAEDGKPVSVVYLIPVTFISKSPEETNSKEDISKKAINTGTKETEGIKCLYLYAAATLPAYRGKGYFGEILKFVKTHMSEPVLLVPGEASLITYYERQGLTVCQKDISIEIEAVSENNRQNLLSVSDITADTYFGLREQALTARNHICWDLLSVRYICMENQHCGGRQVCISLGNEKWLVLFRVEGKMLFVSEILPMVDLTEREYRSAICKLIQILLQEWECKTARVCIQPIVMCNKEIEAGVSDIYFNLTLG